MSSCLERAAAQSAFHRAPRGKMSHFLLHLLRRHVLEDADNRMEQKGWAAILLMAATAPATSVSDMCLKRLWIT